jgi:hypothetical protein
MMRDCIIDFCCCGAMGNREHSSECTNIRTNKQVHVCLAVGPDNRIVGYNELSKKVFEKYVGAQ